MAEDGAIGKYRIVEELGSGGFATVFKAVDTTLGREVALKVLHPPLLVDKSFVERFFREARTLARLRHPSIVTIHEVGSAEGRVFLAMDLAASNLARAIAGTGARLWPEVSAVIEPVAAALDYAHSRGVVHRDLKPANILIDDEGRPLLSDFGFARALGDGNGSFSASIGILGTPSYIAPELWDGRPAEVASDIYALACIAHELFTGKVLFPGDTPLRAVAAHAAGPQLPPGWPPELLAVFRTALARDPAERYGSAGAFAAALRAALQPRSAPEPSPPEPARPAARPAATSAAESSGPQPGWSAAQLAPATRSAAAPSAPKQAPAAAERVVRREPAARQAPRPAAPGAASPVATAAGEGRRPQQVATDRPAARGGAARPAGLWRTLLGALIGAAGWAIFGLLIHEYLSPEPSLERLLINEGATLLTAAGLAVGGVPLSGRQLALFAAAGLLPSAYLLLDRSYSLSPEGVMLFLLIVWLLVAYATARAAPLARWAVAAGALVALLITVLPATGLNALIYGGVAAQSGDSELASVIAVSAGLAAQAGAALLLTFLVAALARRRAAVAKPSPHHSSAGQPEPQE